MMHTLKLQILGAVATIMLLQQPAIAQTFAAPGRVESAGGTMVIGSAATGTIKEVLVHEWKRVRAGELLLTVDCGPLAAEVQAHAAQLEAAAAVFDRVRNGPRPGEIAVGEAAVGYSKAKADEAQKALERTLAMHEGISVTTARILEVQRDARISAAYLAEARAKLSLLREGSREEDIREAEANEAKAAAELQTSRARLEQCSIRAPVDGIVADLLASPGQFLSLAVPAILMHLIPDSALRARVEVEPRDLGRVCVGQSATVTTEAFPNLSLRAKVEALGPALRPRTTIASGLEARAREIEPVILAFEDRQAKLSIGIPLTAHFAPCPSRS